MIVSAKLIVAGAASLFGVALAAGGVLPGIGALTAADARGQVLQLSGVEPVSASPSATPTMHAATTARPQATVTTHATARATATTHSNVGQVAPPAAQPLPSYHAVMPSPMTSAQPAVPPPVHSSPEPAHSSPGTHEPEH